MNEGETKLQGALRRLGENPDWQIVLNDILEHREEEIRALRACHTPDDVLTCSGRITALDELHDEWEAMSSTAQG